MDHSLEEKVSTLEEEISVCQKKLDSSPKGSWIAENLHCVLQILSEEKKKVEERIYLK